MFTSARESYLLREGFRTTSELFTLLGRDRIDWCSNWGGGNMGLYSGGDWCSNWGGGGNMGLYSGGDWCSNWGGGNMGLYSGGGGLYVDRSLYTENMYWFWRRRLRQESALRKGAVSVVLMIESSIFSLNFVSFCPLCFNSFSPSISSDMMGSF